MTGERFKRNVDIDLDHIVSAKTIHDDPVRVLAELNGTDLANTESSLRTSYSSFNRSKKAKSMGDFLQHRDDRLEQLAANKQKRGYILPDEEKELKNYKNS